MFSTYSSLIEVLFPKYAIICKGCYCMCYMYKSVGLCTYPLLLSLKLQPDNLLKIKETWIYGPHQEFPEKVEKGGISGRGS